ncbi:MAG: hypothetical protein MJE66_09860 [Proteobacteria bacterium]|nr:hypothetical protein [Pseudomonadota bacterium]
MIRLRTLAIGIPLLLAGVPGPPAHATDGRVELSQTCAVTTGCYEGDTPGFPITLTAPQSYVLTSPLLVLTDVHAIELQTDGAHIDLNGFEIAGAGVCAVGSCPMGSSSAVTGPAFPAVGGARTRVVRGSVRNFSGTCLSLGAGSRVEGVSVERCGGAGIAVGAGSHALANTVRLVGRSGMSFQGAASVFAHNVVTDHDASGAGHRAVTGRVHATAGNACTDASCTPRGERRFYLTDASTQGGDAKAACAPGFHMAELFELWAPTGLSYDTGLGLTAESDPHGPPTAASGWIKTGLGSLPGATVPGQASCNGYSSSSDLLEGTVVFLEPSWLVATPTVPVVPWQAASRGCESLERVWCVED